MTEDDVKYFYAAARKLGNAQTPLQFRAELLAHIERSYDDAYIMESQVQGKLMPVGVFFAHYAGPLMVVGDISAFPWASPRNKAEAFIHAVNELRRTRLMIFIASVREKRFYEYVCRHGILKRVGTLDDLYEGEGAAMFQSRARK